VRICKKESNLLIIKTAWLKVENSAQTSFRFSPVSFRAPRLLLKLVNYGQKKYYNIGPRMELEKGSGRICFSRCSSRIMSIRDFFRRPETELLLTSPFFSVSTISAGLLLTITWNRKQVGYEETGWKLSQNLGTSEPRLGNCNIRSGTNYSD